jgi:two-component sensor histidine kinase
MAEQFMGTFFARREGTRRTHLTAQARVGHFYLNVAEQKLYCLNEMAQAFIREGMPLTSADLDARPLLTLEGEPVVGADLPLGRCRREGTPQEATFHMPRPAGPPDTLTWSVVPLRAGDGSTSGVTATLVITPPEPDWEELAGLAHDLRTPLQAVRWLIPVLETMPLLPAGAQALEHLRGASDRALAIAKDMLEWCKAPAQGAPRGQRNWLALEPLLQELAAEHTSAARRKGITLDVDLSAVQGVEALTDGTRLGRLIANLLNNAVLYTSTGHVRLQASWRDEPAGKQTLALTVEDTGAGLSADKDSIFQPFQRGKAGQSDDSGGSGLGLAVVDRLIQDLGLTLEVFSEEGQGSRFELLLPAAMLRVP